jgi:hypothetical protein
MAADSREVLRERFRALAAIQAHRRIERVGAHPFGARDMKSTAGKALKQG